MFKVRRGDAPAEVPAVPFHDGQHPINSTVPISGFETGQAGVSHTLRDHDGCKATKTP